MKDKERWETTDVTKSMRGMREWHQKTKKRWAIDDIGHHFHYDRKEGRIFTQHLLLLNSKEHDPYPQEAIVQLEWQDVAINQKNLVSEKPTGSEYISEEC